MRTHLQWAFLLEYYVQYWDINLGVSSTPSKRLSLLSGTMAAEEELLLRSYLISKMNLWHTTQYDDFQSESCIVTFAAGELIEDTQVQLYFHALGDNKKDGIMEASYMVCFMSASNNGLELFHKDLDKYSLKLLPYLEKYVDSVDISKYLSKLEDWYDNITSFVKVCFETFDYGLASLLCAGLCGDTVQMAEDIPKNISDSVVKFLQCCSLSELFTNEDNNDEGACVTSSLNDLVALENHEMMSIKKTSDGTFQVSPRRNSTFCEDCVKQLKVNQSLNEIEMRQMIEAYKLKCIRDMNTFRRLINQAEVDYYTCYRTYLFLVTSGNGIVLMRNTRLQNNVENIKQRRDVLDVLQQFINRMGGFGVFDTKERKELITNTIVNL